MGSSTTSPQGRAEGLSGRPPPYPTADDPGGRLPAEAGDPRSARQASLSVSSRDSARPASASVADRNDRGAGVLAVGGFER